MNIAAAVDRIESTLINLESSVGEPVFNEWALAEKTPEGWKLIEYGGGRKNEFLAEFNTDIAALRDTLDPARPRHRIRCPHVHRRSSFSVAQQYRQKHR